MSSHIELLHMCKLTKSRNAERYKNQKFVLHSPDKNKLSLNIFSSKLCMDSIP